MSVLLGPPEPLLTTHLLDGFDCGEAVLDDWLKRRALANQLSGASRTFVVTDDGSRVVGYYAMAAGAVSHQMATSPVRRNMPDPVPVMVLGRLAVDHRAHGMKLGAALLQDAVNRAVAVSKVLGVQQAIDELKKLSDNPSLINYTYYYSTLAELYLVLKKPANY